MYISRELRNKNIAEYIIYMWQIEDLIRALNFDIEKIEQKVIEPYQLSELDRKALYQWYESLIDMMKTEKVEQTGHLQINRGTMVILQDFNREILETEEENDYRIYYQNAMKSVSNIVSQNPNASDIELCLIFIYGILMLRMKKSEISPETLRAKDNVVKFLQALSKRFQKYEKM